MVGPSRARRLARRLRDTMTGRRSRTLAERRLRRSVTHPRTYHDKVRFKAAFDRDPTLTQLVDKIAVRDLVSTTIGDRYLTAVYAIERNPNGIDWSALPREYACKANHGSGASVMVTESANADARLPSDPRTAGWKRWRVRSENADPDLLTQLCRHWLTLDYSWSPHSPRMPEWAYQDVPRGLLVEEFIGGPDGASPDDVRLYVIHGEVRLIRIVRELGEGRFVSVSYDRDWNVMPVRHTSDRFESIWGDPIAMLPAPREELVAVAEALGVFTDSVRVDLYASGPRIVFGELTVYPHGGEGWFDPDSADLSLGALWRIDTANPYPRSARSATTPN